jgi:hypothetical protein
VIYDLSVFFTLSQFLYFKDASSSINLLLLISSLLKEPKSPVVPSLPDEFPKIVAK